MVTDWTAPDLFDPRSLLDLSQRTDPVGVLSIYVEAQPGADPGLRAAAIDVKNRLSELQRRIQDEFELILEDPRESGAGAR